MRTLLKRIPKLFWLCITIIFVMMWLYQQRLDDAKAHTDHMKHLYQIKNDRGFLTFLKEGHSFIPLAETLEKISQVSDKEDPAQVQQLIEKAKTQSDEATLYMTTLIEFSDDYVEESEPQNMVNHAVMTSKKQSDMYYLALRADVFSLMRLVNYHYWKDHPKIIPQGTKHTLEATAKEIRALDHKLSSFKEMADHAIEWGTPEGNGQIKDLVLKELRPHLEKLAKIESEIYDSEAYKEAPGL